MAMKSRIKIEGLAVGYGKHIVAENLSAELHEGEMICLIGNNGVGKSTLLRTLAGFQDCCSGTMIVNDKIGVVLTEKPDVQHLTVEEIVGMGRSPYTGFFGTLKAADMVTVSRALEVTGISDFVKRNFAELSDGEKQKVMIAKTLAQETPIIILDEPTAFLDYPSKIELMGLLQRLACEEGKSVLFSTHDIEIALQYVNKVWFIDAEHRMCVCPPSAVSLLKVKPYVEIKK